MKKKWWIDRRIPGSSEEQERFEHVTADVLEIRDGALIFKDYSQFTSRMGLPDTSRTVKLSLAPGTWTSVHVDPEDESK